MAQGACTQYILRVTVACKSANALSTKAQFESSGALRPPHWPYPAPQRKADDGPSHQRLRSKPGTLLPLDLLT